MLSQVFRSSARLVASVGGPGQIVRLTLFAGLVVWSRPLHATNPPPPPPPPPCSGQPVTVTIQASLDGTTWYTDSMWIYAKTFDVKYVKVRALLTTNVNDVQGWSYGVEHDSSSLLAGYGAMTVQLVTTNGTHTATVQSGGQPDFNATQRQGNYAFTQAVVIDFYGGAKLPSKINFVAAGACYQLFVPSQSGTYQVELKVTSDVGSPPVDACGVWQGKSIHACSRNFTFNISCQPTYPPGSGSCSSSGPWIIAGDNTPGSGSWIGTFPLSTPLTPPFFCGHVNEDNRLNIADPVFLLNYLFLGGSAPSIHRVDLPVVKQTGQRLCYSNNDGNNDPLCDGRCDPPEGGVPGCPDPPPDRIVPRPPCPDPSAQDFNFCGQDGYYLAGAPRSYIVKPGDIVADCVTSLEWERKPGIQFFHWYAALKYANDAMRGAEGQPVSEDWRLPNVFEALSVCNYGQWHPAVDPVFDFSAHPLEVPELMRNLRFWTSTPWVVDLDQRWRLNYVEGHLANNPYDQFRKAWIVRGGFLKDAPANAAPPVNGFPVSPMDLANVNNDMNVNLTDVIFLLNFLFLGGPPPCYVSNLVLRTGVTKCFDCNPPHNPVPCLAPGATGPNCPPAGSGIRMEGGEDAFYATTTPLGQPRRFRDEVETVVDLATGLEWLAEPVEQIFQIRNGFPKMNWEEALLFCEGLEFDGRDDWRLPNVNELATLINFGAENQEGFVPPKIFEPFFSLPLPETACQELDAQGFPGNLVNVLGFWTSTTSTRPLPDGTDPFGRTQAFVVDFQEGLIHNDELCNDKNGIQAKEINYTFHFVWPVRGGL